MWKVQNKKTGRETKEPKEANMEELKERPMSKSGDETDEEVCERHYAVCHSCYVVAMACV